MPDSAAIRAHVDKILASPGFIHSDRLRRFLDFTVQAHLNGESGQIKEYVLGREVFDRADGYDPRTDPIVRVEARRLRQRLDEYYAGPGRAEPLRVEFPKGAYVPAIRAVDSAPVPPRRRWFLAAPAALAAAGAAWYFARKPAPSNSVAIVPARWTFPDPSGLDPADEALAEAVTAQVANRGSVPVIGWPAILPYRREPKPFRELASATGASMVLAISVRRNGGPARISVFLLEPFTGRKRWAEDFYQQDLASPQDVRTVAAAIAEDLQATLGLPGSTPRN